MNGQNQASPRATAGPRNILYVIKADGTVSSKRWTGRLEYKMPALKELYPLMESGCTLLEHVRLWAGFAHMFVDEDGLSKDLETNLLASLLAHTRIVGTALIWEGDMK